ncbi:MAG: hypothetical protein JWN06_2863 [Propionibacteriaceae bacterium]|nr:hypothetical protein [Propionibacteriaceae bacterium]
MSQPVGQWRASYTAGEWIVLAGPTSLVVLEPSAAADAELVSTLWEEVLAAGSITELASRMAAFGIEAMPTFAAFFWTADGMRSLVRGAVSVVDLSDGAIVADGAGIQTWTETGLGGVEQVRIDMQPGGLAAAELPLVVGAVRAGSVLLDARVAARVTSPQVAVPVPSDFVADEPAAAGAASWWEFDQGAEATAPVDADAVDTPTPTTAWYPAPSGYEDADTELMPSVEASEQRGPDEAPAAPVPPLAPTSTSTPIPPPPPISPAGRYDEPAYAPPPVPEPGVHGEAMIMAVVCPLDHPNPPTAASCVVCGAPIPPQRPQLRARPALATVRAPDGSGLALDGPVLIGRAPSADRSDSPGARLMTVLSPSQDISRTHVQIAPEGWQVVVTDLGSTNGTLLIPPGRRGQPQRLATGQPVTVSLGSILELGDGVRITIDPPHRDQ